MPHDPAPLRPRRASRTRRGSDGARWLGRVVGLLLVAVVVVGLGSVPTPGFRANPGQTGANAGGGHAALVRVSDLRAQAVALAARGPVPASGLPAVAPATDTGTTAEPWPGTELADAATVLRDHVDFLTPGVPDPRPTPATPMSGGPAAFAQSLALSGNSLLGQALAAPEDEVRALLTAGLEQAVAARRLAGAVGGPASARSLPLPAWFGDTNDAGAAAQPESAGSSGSGSGGRSDGPVPGTVNGAVDGQVAGQVAAPATRGLGSPAAGVGTAAADVPAVGADPVRTPLFRASDAMWAAVSSDVRDGAVCGSDANADGGTGSGEQTDPNPGPDGPDVQVTQNLRSAADAAFRLSYAYQLAGARIGGAAGASAWAAASDREELGHRLQSMVPEACAATRRAAYDLPEDFDAAPLAGAASGEAQFASALRDAAAVLEGEARRVLAAEAWTAAFAAERHTGELPRLR